MTKIICSISTMLVATFMGTSAFAGELMVNGSAKMDKKGEITISGKDFPKGAEVTLIFTTADGVDSDISYALKPAPVADADGNFSTTWSYGRFVKKKLVAPGEFSLLASDTDFNPLAETKITFAE
ncbi:hypothetical protein E1162_13080 [Rhodobacteraceae bacterium RKSG542]|uniref:hypothetical protein n=1 Tax=Pseudovibrio flavus TaxID=2529854 RepID=UPI0012BC58F9|nr:hypothetical protein [Pseudovibrio flavus]MTI18173.1 hypothetical protein [Pseudovibrio flavus]